MSIRIFNNKWKENLLDLTYISSVGVYLSYEKFIIIKDEVYIAYYNSIIL